MARQPPPSQRRLVPQRLLLSLLLLVCTLGLGHGRALSAGDAATQAPVLVLLCADGGAQSGVHELGGLVRAMEDAQELSLKYCEAAHLGTIRREDGHAVRSLVVATGINHISSTLCTRSVLRLRRERDYTYDAMVFVGTSGLSPMVGGWDPTNTSSYAAFRERESAAAAHGEAAESDVTAASPAPLFLSVQQVRDAHVAEVRRRQAAVEAGEFLSVPTASQLNFENTRTGEQLDWDGCSPRLPSAITPLSLGSVCVTSTAFLHESGSCTERPRHTQCSRPHCAGFEHGLSNEMKIFYTSDQLVRGIEAATHGKTWPAMPDAVRAGLDRLWAANEAVEPVGTGAERHRAAPSTPTFVTCAEATGNTVLAGAERDFLCREQTAHAVNLMRRQYRSKAYRDADTPEPPVTTQTVACVHAMESMGFLRTIADDSTARGIPVAVVRGAARYMMHPMRKVYVPPAVWRSVLAAGQLTVSPRVAAALAAAAAEKHDDDDGDAIAAYTWHQYPLQVSEEEQAAFVAASLRYAVDTATFVLSNFFFGGRHFA